MRPTIVAVGGFTSNSGKTTLVCELLRALDGWEAIKTTRGHYRSCGRDPHACCVSHLLGAEPLVLSGRDATYAEGKDTGRYWDAGAANVHWVVTTDAQVGRGFETALARVRSAGVIVEGNSFLEHAEADFVIMVARPDSLKIKTTAGRALPKTSALYVSQFGERHDPNLVEEFLRGLRGAPRFGDLPEQVPVYTAESLAPLIARVRAAQTPSSGAWPRSAIHSGRRQES
jgi:molybdopterin-guanine dinucleotide biosynthesis protein